MMALTRFVAFCDCGVCSGLLAVLNDHGSQMTMAITRHALWLLVSQDMIAEFRYGMTPCVFGRMSRINQYMSDLLPFGYVVQLC